MVAGEDEVGQGLEGLAIGRALEAREVRARGRRVALGQGPRLVQGPVLAGQEQKVHDNLVKRIKTEEMGDFVYEVLIPTERVSEVSCRSETR